VLLKADRRIKRRQRAEGRRQKAEGRRNLLLFYLKQSKGKRKIKSIPRQEAGVKYTSLIRETL
jgi:hypothetical protein